MTKRNPNPNSNQRQAPSTARDTPDGKMLIWFKPESAAKPEKFDYSVPHHTRAGWRVYFLLACFVAVPVCCVIRLVMEVL